MRFVLRVDPIPKGRPRFVRGSGRVFTPQNTKEYEDRVRMLTKQILGSWDSPVFPKGTPVFVDIDFVIKRPQRLERKKDPPGLLWAEQQRYDVDNLVKSVLDAFNELLWDDDRQVVGLRSRKLYAEKKGPARLAVSVRSAKSVPVPDHLCDTWGDQVEMDWLATEDRPSSDSEYKPQEEDPNGEEYERQWRQTNFVEELDAAIPEEAPGPDV